MKSLAIICLLPSLLFASFKSIATVEIKSKTEHRLAKIKMSEAIIIAQSKSVGKLVESSLERKNNFLVYSFTFAEPNKKISEIKIDADTGNILIETNY